MRKKAGESATRLEAIESATSLEAKEASESATRSVKYDQDKPALQYVPREAMVLMGDAFGFGARKYAPENYKISGLEVSRCLGAALRHIYAYLDGETFDPESGVNHLGHSMAAIAMAIDSAKRHPNKDDRFKK